MEFFRKNLATFIKAAILFTLGLLFIIVGAANDASGDAANAVSIIIGVVFLVVGILSVCLLAWVGIKNKASFAGVAAGAAALIGVGISLFVNHYAMDLVGLFLYVMPYVLIAVGAVVVFDAILVIVRAAKSKESVLPGVLDVIVGAVVITLGCLCVGNDPVIKGNTQLIIFGIIVIVLAVLVVVTTLLVKKNNK